MLKNTGRRELAVAFARSVADSAAERSTKAPEPDADALLADLLAATLVDARDELVAARGVLDGAEPHERSDAWKRAESWMIQPPPWPPASIESLLGRGENAMALVETLAAQLAPDADVRAWLVRSWLSPPRPVDGALLNELARAEGGRLCREPRFRAWLRSEWTAWARQRYRRVARLVRQDGVS